MLNGIDVNLEQVNAGLAWHYKKYEKEQLAIDRFTYANSETSAKAARRGLWADENPVSPWLWRISSVGLGGEPCSRKKLKISINQTFSMLKMSMSNVELTGSL